MRTLLAILLIVFAAAAKAQQPFSRDYWLAEAGTPHKVSTMVQDAAGYLYLGTAEGLYRFNGRSFLHIADSIQEPVTALAAAENDIYVGYADGRLAYIHAGKITEIRPAGPRPASSITCLVARWGCLFAGTEAEGFFGIAGGYSRVINSASGLADNFVYALAFPVPGTILAATDQGLSCIDFSGDGRFTVKPAAGRSALPDNIVRVLQSLQDTAGYLWAGTQDAGFFHYTAHPDGRGPVINTSRDWHWGQLNDILPLSSNHAWAATESGYLLECFYTADSGYIIYPHLYEGRKMKKLLADAAGNIWCATSEGLTMVTANYLSYLSVGDRYHLKSLTAMSFDREDNLWYSLGKDLYRRMKSGVVKKQYTAPALITSLHPDSAGRLWVGTLGAGLLYLAGQDYKTVKLLDGIAGAHILDISGNGKVLWVSSLNGVEELKINDPVPAAPEIIRHHGKHSGAGSDYIYQLFPDRQGRLWFATDGAGITMWDGRQYHSWDGTSGFNSKVVYSIAQDARDHIWVATLDKGLYEWAGARWQQFGEQSGLQDINISSIAANGSGQLVVVHSKGLDEWFPTSHDFRHYNRRSGMDIDTQSTALNCSAVDSKGTVWIPFEHGFIQFLSLAKPYRIKPGIAITETSLFQHPLQEGKQSFAADENYIGFRFEAVSFTNPEKLYYRYQLKGYDQSWVATSDEQASFPRLPSGKYTFRVQASLDGQFEDAAITTYTFQIATPLWRRPWMIALLLLMAGTGTALLLRQRERNLRRLAMLQQARMMAEYEQLKSQVNPHFLFNSLNTLVSLIEEAPQAAVTYTTELSDLYRSMLSYRDRDLILLAEEWELLRKYFYIQQNRFTGSLHLDTDIPDALLMSKRILPLALQLLVENAIKHNIVSASKPLRIRIETTEDGITVRHKLQPKLSREKGAGLGLMNIRKRYALLTKRAVSFGIKGDEYIVTLPLL